MQCVLYQSLFAYGEPKVVCKIKRLKINDENLISIGFRYFFKKIKTYTDEKNYPNLISYPSSEP